MCAGSHLANRELFTAFIRLFTAFRIVAPRDPNNRPILDALECNAVKTSLTTDPYPFKVGFRVRDEGNLRKWMEESEERTKELARGERGWGGDTWGAGYDEVNLL